MKLSLPHIPKWLQHVATSMVAVILLNQSQGEMRRWCRSSGGADHSSSTDGRASPPQPSHSSSYLGCTSHLSFSLGVVVFLIYEFITVLQNQPDDLFGTVRAILLTIAAVIGLPFLIWRTRIADRQNQINREGHYTELFSKAAELLGTTRTEESGRVVPVIEARVGAIFALERLSKTSATDYGPIVETLSAYVRERCGKGSIFTFTGDDPDEEGIPCSRTI